MTVYVPQLITGFIDGLRPEPRLSVAEWSERYRKLDTKSAAEPGPYRVARTPYLREILDFLSVRNNIQKIVFKKGVQLGLTEIGHNWIGYVIDVVPSPMMAVQPTLDTMKRNVKLRIDPMFENCDRLRDKIGQKRSRDGGNTMLQKDYPGGALVLTGANSAAGLRSMPVRFLFLDEVDAYPQDVDGEGNAISLAEKRTATFGSRKKVFEISTPTIEGLSIIDADFLQTDQRYYHVPCPHCNGYQVLRFELLRWDKGSYKEVYYECAHCQARIMERHKTRMLDLGKWVPSRPDLSTPETVGYHLSTLYSPDGWMSWAQIAKEYDDAQGDEPKIKTFVNTILGECYREKGEAPAWERLYERAQAEGHEPNTCFASVAFVTAGADIQADRIEVEIVGWMNGRRSQQIDYRVLMGDTDRPEVWNQLAEILDETFPREGGGSLPLRLMAVDTGYRTDKAYDFARKFGTRRVIAVKGSEALQMPFAPPRVIDRTKQGKSIGKVKVWHIGVSYLKSQLYGWLRSSIDPDSGEIPPGYCHFTQRDPHYFRGLTAETLQQTKNSRGMAAYVWVKKYERNEPLDCRIYATSAAYTLGFDRWTPERWQQEAGRPQHTRQPQLQTATPKSAPRKTRDRGDNNYWKR